LFTMSKIQFLKAIHNRGLDTVRKVIVVYDVKDTIFESNSQRNLWWTEEWQCCLRCQRYNFWKQFTTVDWIRFEKWLLFTMSKIQFLKAIHNSFNLDRPERYVVYDVKDTIFESNSQPKSIIPDITLTHFAYPPPFYS